MALSTIQVKQLSADGFQWNKYSERVGSITNELTHFSRVAYFAFDDWDSAHAFFKAITAKHLCSRAHVRESERFTTRFEVKVWGMSESTLEKLVTRDRNRTKKNRTLPPIRRDWSLSESYSATQYEAA